MAAPIREGDLLAGKYRVERVVGQGAMGVVVAARHVDLDQRVAVKLLLPHMLEQHEAVVRFLREARAAARIENEHVARVTDVGRLESGAPYMVMEYLEGSDLATLLTMCRPLPIEDAVDYVTQACEAIAQAHALGIIHRDLKPANLMLVRRGDGSPCIKVLDFGISKLLPGAGAGDAMAMTRTAAVLGSPSYMAPEQMMSTRDVDGRADIWSLGVVLYELLTGSVPFVADTLPGLGMLLATTEPIPLRVRRPEVVPALEAVVLRCLAKNREDRFAGAAELAEALAPFLAGAGGRPSLHRTAQISLAASAPPIVATPAAPNALPRRRTVMLAAGAGVALVAVMALAAFVIHRSPSETFVVPPPANPNGEPAAGAGAPSEGRSVVLAPLSAGAADAAGGVGDARSAALLSPTPAPALVRAPHAASPRDAGGLRAAPKASSAPSKKLNYDEM